MAIAALFHVDQIEHDDAAEIAQANLARNLFDGFHVRAGDRVFETRGAAPDEFAGVHVDRHQRFGLIDHQITAGFQPDARLNRFINLDLHSKCFQDWLVARVELDALDQARLHPIHKLDDALVLVFRIDANGGEVFRELIAQNSLHQIQITMDQRRRLSLLGVFANVLPRAQQIASIGAQISLGGADPGRADDKTAHWRSFFNVNFLNQLAQPRALAV